jgi:hypothetical protein
MTRMPCLEISLVSVVFILTAATGAASYWDPLRLRRAVLPAAEWTRTFSPCSFEHVWSSHRQPPSDTRLASVLPRLLILHLGTASSSWTPPSPLSATDPPGVALHCWHPLRLLVSPGAHFTEAPASSEPRWTLHVVEVDKPPTPPRHGPRPRKGPPGVVSRYLLVSTHAHLPGTQAPSAPRRRLPVVEVDQPPSLHRCCGTALTITSTVSGAPSICRRDPIRLSL